MSDRHRRSPAQSWALALGIVTVLLIGCRQTTTQPSPDGLTYTGVLDASYEGALDAVSQLALGTLELEGTGAAVTEPQAVVLLPLWQALQGSGLQGDAERYAVVKQIEAAMTKVQISAIADMQLTQEDSQTWMQSQGNRAGPGGGRAPGARPGQGGAPTGMSEEQMQQMREQFSNMSPEERATRRAQAGRQRPQGGADQAGPTAAGGTAAGLTRAVIVLLAERSGREVAQRSRAAPTPTPTATPLPRRTRPAPTATVTPEPTAVLTPTGVAEQTNTPEPTPTLVQTPTATATQVSADGRVPAPAAVPAATTVPALQQIQDTDPGPPFSIEISANAAAQDPLVEQSRRYKITGIVRNDGDRTYAVSALHVTFYDAEGFRGSFFRFPGRGRTGGEWIWHGQTEADLPCLLLAPGKECPFIVEITAQNMASFLIHPDAVATERTSVSMELGSVVLIDEGVDYVRITGTAINGDSSKVKNVIVSGVLLDVSGQIVSVGSTYVLQEDIEPGASVPFDLRIKRESFVGYQLYAQAERDRE